MRAAVLPLFERVGHQEFRRARNRQKGGLGHVVERTPVEDVLDDSALAMQAMVLRARAAPAFDEFSTTPSLLCQRE